MSNSKDLIKNPYQLIPCRYYLMGTCSKGDSCMFDHTSATPTAQNLPDGPPICSFYLQGNCSRGDSCRYRHVSKSELNKSSQSSTSKNHHLSYSSSSKTTKNNHYNPKITKKPSSFADAINPDRNNNKLETLTDTSSNSSKMNPKAEVFVPQFENSNFITSTSNEMTTIHLSGESLSKNSAIVYEKFKVPEHMKINDFCPEHVETGICSAGGTEYCFYKIHGNQCPSCTLYLINPDDPKCNHLEKCMEAHQESLEEEEKINDSKKLKCTICMDVVWEKTSKSERRFGLLEACDHVFCLACIREWRATKTADNSAIRGCPTCRKPSNFVIPSEFFVKDEKKQALIETYKSALSQKHCMHFRRGKGECPFGISCFYKHQYEDGTLQDRSMERLRYNANGQLIDLPPSHPLFEMLREELEEGGRLHHWQREQRRNRDDPYMV